MGTNFFENDMWVDIFPNFDADESKKKREEIIGNAFNALSKHADEYHGHEEGYSGEINAKDGWMYLGSMTRKKYNTYMDSYDRIYIRGLDIDDWIKWTERDLSQIKRASTVELQEKKKNLQKNLRTANEIKTKFNIIKTDPIYKKIKECNDSSGPACAVLISDEKREINSKKTTGFKFSPINKSARPFVVYNCDKYNAPNTFTDLTSAKAMVNNNVGKNYCMNPSITKIDGTIKVDPMIKEIKQRQALVIFFGGARS